MIENFYPNPIVVQRLQAGPLSAHIDTFFIDEEHRIMLIRGVIHGYNQVPVLSW